MVLGIAVFFAISLEKERDKLPVIGRDAGLAAQPIFAPVVVLGEQASAVLSKAPTEFTIRNPSLGTPIQRASSDTILSPYERMALAEPARTVPLVSPPPPGSGEIRIRLADSINSEAAERFASMLLRGPDIGAAHYDAAAHELVVSGRPSSLDAKSLATQADAAGLEVLGEVLNLPLQLSPHASACGSCGYYVAQKLAAEPGVKAVEIFVPVRSQLRLLTTPGAFTPAAVAGRLATLEPDLSKPLP